MPRPAIVVALPRDEFDAVSSELTSAGFQPIHLEHPAELEAVLLSRNDVALAVLDAETDFDRSIELYSLLHEDGRAIPALMVVSPRALDRMSGAATKASLHDEYFTRPYSIDALRWRLEAMLIRTQTVDDGSGAVLQSEAVSAGDWARRAAVVAVFNPKGGVGKTTVAVNLAAALRVRHDQNVLLIDGDTVTGHIATSLALEGVRSVVDSWVDEAEGGERELLGQIAAGHGSGLKVAVLASGPLGTDILEPTRVGDAILAARRGFDYVIVDMHPDYGALNRAIFERADRILVPVTPDVPAIRAAVQLREVAAELGLADRLSMVVNRANSGVSVADMERTVGMPALALVRSGGLKFIHAANEGRSVVEKYPKEKIARDFDTLAARVMGVPGRAERGLSLRGLLGRPSQPVRA